MNGVRILYVGMDVDSEKIAMAAIGRFGTNELSEQVIRNNVASVKKYFDKLKETGAEVRACYEAGFCGFELVRQLLEMDISCTVAAPGMLPKKPSDRIKTDRRDARTLARALRNGDIHEVNVPTKEDEATRDYLRMHEDVKIDLKRAKQRLLHFLHRRGLRYTDGNNWTGKHRRWLKALRLENSLEQETLNEYYTCIEELEEKCERLAARVEEIACEDQYVEPVRLLKAFKGIGTLTALSLVAEIGDFHRFATAEQFMAFLGLVPSEHSSGNKRRQGAITKAGNSHLRRLLIEASWHYRSYHADSKRLAKRREGLPVTVVSYAQRAGRRLNKKFVRMLFSQKPSQVAATAVARELSGFIWGAMLGKTA
jgi:transposase